MQNSCAISWGEVPIKTEAPVQPKASRRAKWVFALGLGSTVYVYALFLYVSNPVIQHWIAVRFPIVNAPGAFLVIMAAGLGISLPACVLGWRELAAIRRGEIPRAGRFITWVGFLLALLSCSLFYVGLVALRFVKEYALGVVNPLQR